MKSVSDAIAIIGAGPFGLAIAAYLRHLGLDFRIFGTPMLGKGGAKSSHGSG